MEEKKFFATPQGVIKPSQATGAVPAYIIGGWDPSDNQYHVINLGNLVEPLVQAEQLYILGLLDGREEDYDRQSLTIPTLAAIGAEVRERLTVPADEVWFITTVELTTPADQGGTPTLNWRCSLWTDRAAIPDANGQAFRETAYSNSPGGGTVWDEFNTLAPLWALTGKPVVLRLPGGSVITAVAINTVAQATAQMISTLKLYGYKGKSII